MQIFSHLSSTLETFWRQHPALLYACALLLGLYSALFWNPTLLLPIFLIFYPFIFFRDWSGSSLRLFLALLIMIFSFFYAVHNYHLPKLDKEHVEGLASIKITSIEPSRTRFATTWRYKGLLEAFIPYKNPLSSQLLAKNIRFHMSLPREPTEEPPQLGNAYILHASLQEIAVGTYILKPKKDEQWQLLDTGWSLLHWRRHAKQTVTNYIHNHISNTIAANFLAGIATGNFDDYHLLSSFSRFGLLHIMAISGFHFAILSGILLFFLRFFLSYRWVAIILALFTTCYFLFLGCNPSVVRSWITILVVLIGNLLQKSGSALNSLGLAMLVILLFDPLDCASIGFQLSFLITAAILFFYPIVSKLLQKLWKKRRLSEMIFMDGTNQHGYIILTWLREGLALILAVHIIAFPITLYYFQKFPWMSLLYNMFFPFLVSISMILLIIGCFFFWCAPIAEFFHYLNDYFTQFTLNLVLNIPTTVDFFLRVDKIPTYFMIGYLTLTFLVGILLYRKNFDLRSV